MVEVVVPTSTADGSLKKYPINVPIKIPTAREFITRLWSHVIMVVYCVVIGFELLYCCLFWLLADSLLAHLPTYLVGDIKILLLLFVLPIP